MKIKVFLIVLCGLFIGCAGSQRTIAPTAQSKTLDALVAQKALQIESDWAYPLATNSINRIANIGLLPPGSAANNISLIGNSNYLKIKGDSIAMYLPYFGQRQIAGGYNRTDIGIEFKGKPDQYKITKHERKQYYTISFYIKNNEESCKVIVTLFPNFTTNIAINSSHRTSIQYKGVVSKLSEKDKFVSTQ